MYVQDNKLLLGQQYLFIQQMSTQLTFLEKIVQDLIKAKHNNYSQECTNFYIDDNLFSMEDIPKLYNPSKQRLKCSFIRHRKYDNNNKNVNSVCIIYLHGFGSSRLQALPLIELLPLEYCICIFDMSGSGKSEGQKITYGVKQQEDIGMDWPIIDPIIKYLCRKKSIREFVIWGRSMGAVAALLYAINNKRVFGKISRDRRIPSVTQSLKNSIIMPNNNQTLNLQQQITIHSLVLDSPFYKFSQIAKEIAQKKLLIPSFLLDIALNYVEQSFTKILSQSIGQKYNPFQINFDKRIKVNIPAIFVYSENDQIICHSHSERLITQMDSQYSKVVITPCTHNQTRPQAFVRQIFAILDRTIHSDRSMDRVSEYFQSKSISRSCDKKKGIAVYTTSRQKRKQPQHPTSHPKFHQTINIQMVKTQQIGIKSPRFKSTSKKSIVTLQINKLRRSKQLQTASTQKQLGIPQLNSMDLQVNKFLSKKLIDSKKQVCGVKMTRTTKRHSYDKRKDFQFYNDKY